MVLYKVSNLVNGKVYIGQTRQKLHKRINAHKIADTYLGRALRKYGMDNFKVDVIGEFDNSGMLNEAERIAVEYYKCIIPNGYNAIPGGAFAPTMSPSVREKLSRVLTGKTLPLEVRRKISNSLKGKKKSKDHIDKVRKASLGRTMSPETRAKVSASKSAGPVRCVDTGEVFTTAAEAAKSLNICKCNILRVMKGIRATAGGLKFELVAKE